MASSHALSRTLALGVVPGRDDYRLAVRLQRRELERSDTVEAIRRKARGEVDVRYIGRVIKRSGADAIPWFQGKLRPLRIGGSIGHHKITAGTLGGFVSAGAGSTPQIGRTTGVTRGRITAIEMDNVLVDYDLGTLRFDQQIEIEGADDASFSAGGDSGALVVDAAGCAVALLFAGGDQGGSNGQGLTYANPLRPVLEALKVDLMF